MTRPQQSLWLVPLLLLVGAACSTGEGEGEVRSEALFVRDCWDGPFDLAPDFFGANAFSREQVAIRMQRGDNNQEVSDGLSIIVHNVQEIREERLDVPVRVGLPAGVSPPGTTIQSTGAAVDVSLALYLHATCHLQNSALYSVDRDGSSTITFHHLMSGDRNELEGGERLTDAEFDADFVDPRDVSPDGSFDPAVVSRVRGWFRFYFQRGQPAQPFP